MGSYLPVDASETPSPAPRVSIVLPTYNRAAMLPAAIESVLAQTFNDFELIIVDDGSTDATAQVAERYAARDPRVRVIRKRNGGLPAALNSGFAVARGALFTWTSDDNAYGADALAAMVAELHGRPEVGLVYAGYTIVYDDGRPNDRFVFDKPPAPDEPGFVGACFLYRRTLAERVGPYDTTIPLAEDTDYWLRCRRVMQFAYIPRDLYLYREHGAALTTARRVACLLAAGMVRARRTDSGVGGLYRSMTSIYWAHLKARGVAAEPARVARWCLKGAIVLALLPAWLGLPYTWSHAVARRLLPFGRRP